jgi:hypothetical protein
MFGVVGTLSYDQGLCSIPTALIISIIELIYESLLASIEY